MSKKLGVERGRNHEAVEHEKTFADTKEHKHVPGRVFEHVDATTKLITMIGGGFFNEPRYYDTNRSHVDFYSELLNNGAISSVITDSMGISEQARDVINAAHAVAQESPEDLLVIASWARDTEKGLKLRYTPQIMLALAAANASTKKFVPKYATKIIRRADEIKQVFAAFRHLFHPQNSIGHYKGSLPHCLRVALALAFTKQSLYGLLKYNTDDRPTFGDVLRMLGGSDLKRRLRQHGVEHEHYPVSKAMFNYFVNGEIGEDAPKMLKLRKEFFSLGKGDISKVSSETLSDAGLTWENVVSHFGSSKAVWELCIPLMGEMALTRNLRNFEEAKISKESWDKVYEKCTSIKDTKQLPFRFFSAEKHVSGTDAKAVTDKMLDNACMNIPELPGVTVIFVDNSGSATGTKVSGKSNLRVSDAGNILAAIVAKRFGRNAMVGVFGDCHMWVPFSPSDSCMATKKLIDDVAQRGEHEKYDAKSIIAGGYYDRGRGVGGGTETGLWVGIHDLTERKIKVDRIIIASDFCCYTKGDAVNCGHDMTKHFGAGGERATIQSMINKYRNKVNPDCWVHSINLQGYGQTQLDPKATKVQQLSGWSEQVFGLMLGAEVGTFQKEQSQQDGPTEVPTIELLREMYKVTE